MRFVRPSVYLIAKSTIQERAVEEWLNGLNLDVITRNKYAFDRKGKTDAERLIELAGRRCYMAFKPGVNPNVVQIREDIADYIKNILKQKHGSVLAHYTCTFALENISRVLSGELNRHSVGTAISEGSQRYIRFTDIPVVETNMLRVLPEEPTTEEELLNVKIRATRACFEKAFKVQEEVYAEMQEIWKDELSESSKFSRKKEITSLMRRPVGIGVATGGVWTFNIRSLRHVCTMRAAEAAEEEIAEVAIMLLDIMRREEPSLFGDFHLNEKGYWTPTYEKV